MSFLNKETLVEMKCKDIIETMDIIFDVENSSTTEILNFHDSLTEFDRPRIQFLTDAKLDMDKTAAIIEDLCDIYFNEVEVKFANVAEASLQKVIDILYMSNVKKLYCFVLVNETLMAELFKAANEHHFDFYCLDDNGDVQLYKHECCDKTVVEYTPEEIKYNSFVEDVINMAEQLYRLSVLFADNNMREQNTHQFLSTLTGKEGEQGFLVISDPISALTKDDLNNVYRVANKQYTEDNLVIDGDVGEYVILIDGLDDIYILVLVRDDESVYGKVDRVFKHINDTDFEELLFMKDNKQELFGASVLTIGHWN